jgi:hypothetical protein
MEILKCWNRDMLIITQIAVSEKKKPKKNAKNYINNVKIAEEKSNEKCME